ncbi:hypothetical protein [Phenylobacterium sp.]|jgi:integrase|uniref:hypothetical protein n=1 Tax=Phenylobacterium sp. TaxID=1871053 RepID=UPI002F9291CE
MQTNARGPAGWVVGVMVKPAGETAHLRHYYAVGCAEQGKAEWTAVDMALREGAVAESPVGGLEPVAALRPLPLQRMAALGLRPGETRALGWKHPRRWLA